MAHRLHMAQRELDLLRPIPNKPKDAAYYKSLLDRYFGANHVLSKENTMLALQRSLSASFPTHSHLVVRRNLDQQFPNIRFSPFTQMQPNTCSVVDAHDLTVGPPLSVTAGSYLPPRQVLPQQMNFPHSARQILPEDIIIGDTAESVEAAHQEIANAYNVPVSTNNLVHCLDRVLISHAANNGPNSLSAFRMLTTANTVNATNSLLSQHHHNQSLNHAHLHANNLTLGVMAATVSDGSGSAANHNHNHHNTNNSNKSKINHGNNANNQSTNSSSAPPHQSLSNSSSASFVNNSKSADNMPYISHISSAHNKSQLAPDPPHSSSATVPPPSSPPQSSSSHNRKARALGIPLASRNNSNNNHNYSNNINNNGYNSINNRYNYYINGSNTTSNMKIHQNRSPSPSPNMSVSSFAHPGLKSPQNHLHAHSRSTSAYPLHTVSKAHPSSNSHLTSSTSAFSSSFTYYLSPKQVASSSSLQPSYSQRWQNKGSTLANLNERTVPAYQRSKLARKPLGSTTRPGPLPATVQEIEYRSMANMLETEAERNRLLAKTGYQPEWRSDNSTPSRLRTLSAKNRDNDLSRCIPQPMSQGLSVVSAPAPVSLRPDNASPSQGYTKANPPQVQLSSNTNSDRSTRSQRIRGASNNIRLRQIEMREHHAYVQS